MNKFYCYLSAGLLSLFIAFSAKAQLNAEEKKAILDYCASNIKFAIINPNTHQAMVNDNELVHALRPCVDKIKNSVALNKLRGIPHFELAELNRELRSKMGVAYRDKLLPNFNEKDWLQSESAAEMLKSEGYKLEVKGDHSVLMEKYERSRKEKFNPENAITNLEFGQPEELSRLRAELKKQYKSKQNPDSAADFMAASWLEKNYWFRTWQKASRQITQDLTSKQNELKNCDLVIGQILAKMDQPTKWDGLYTSKFTQSVKITGKTGLLTYDNAFWNGSLEFQIMESSANTAKGSWKDLTLEGDAPGGNKLRSGSFEATLEGNMLTIKFKEKAPATHSWTFTGSRK